MRKFKFAKLVRDKIVDGIIFVGNKPNWRELSEFEYIKQLKEKIVEECEEILKTEDNNEIVKELADIQEVIDNLLSALKVSKKRLTEIQLEKNNKNGSFKKRHYIENVETPDDTTEWVKYYLNNPDKYPELK